MAGSAPLGGWRAATGGERRATGWLRGCCAMAVKTKQRYRATAMSRSGKRCWLENRGSVLRALRVARLLFAPTLAGCGATVRAEDVTQPDAADANDSTNARASRDGTTDTANAPPTIRDEAPTSIRHLSVGSATACAALDDGSLWCWGLIDGTSITPITPFATRMRGVDRVVRSAHSDRYSCALREDQTVWCWGAHRFVTGASGFDNWLPPEPLPGLSQIRTLSESCAIDNDGAVFCWGGNVEQRHAPGAGRFIPPTRIAGLPPSIAVGHLGSRTCAMTREGQLFCWGTSTEHDPRLAGLPLGSHGVLAGPRTSAPVESMSSSSVHLCALTIRGEVECVGRTSSAQIRRTEFGFDEPEFLRVPTPTRAVGVSTTVQLTTALLASGQVFEWGATTFGQRDEPSAVPGVDLASLVATGDTGRGTISCAARERRAWCWGESGAPHFGPAGPHGRQQPPTLIRWRE